jgi:hypothetical protein
MDAPSRVNKNHQVFNWWQEVQNNPMNCAMYSKYSIALPPRQELLSAMDTIGKVLKPQRRQHARVARIISQIMKKSKKKSIWGI